MRKRGVLGRIATPLLVLVLLASTGARIEAQDGGVQKLGVINVGRLLEESTAGKAALEKLKNLKEQKEAEARTMEEEITGLRDKLSEGRLSLSEERLEEMQKELEDEIIDYRRFQDDTQRLFQKEQVEMFEIIQKDVMPIITAVGEELGFTMIFNKFESGLVFAREEVDVTDIILERFNVKVGTAEVGG